MKNSNSMPIAWHEDGLKNRWDNATRLKKEIESKQIELDKLIKENVFLATQIEGAKNQGKTHFDAERFLIKRKTK